MEEITQWLIFALWIMMAGLWLPNILQVVWWRFNAWGYLAAWIGNLGFAWLVGWVLPAFGVIPPLPDYLQYWLLMLLGAAAFLPATLLTKPEPMDRLVDYYVMTRPLGWWAPVHEEAVRRGMIEEVMPAESASRRPWIRRRWTAEEASEWTREDWIAIVLSPVVYGLIMFGLVDLLLLRMEGLGLLALAAAGWGVIYWVIDPKLRAVSAEYETRQAGYAAALEASLKWDAASEGAEG